jgi:hypothetical protein
MSLRMSFFAHPRAGGVSERRSASAGREALADQRHHLARLRIPPEHRLREHELAVQVHVEDAVCPGYDLDAPTSSSHSSRMRATRPAALGRAPQGTQYSIRTWWRSAIGSIQPRGARLPSGYHERRARRQPAESRTRAPPGRLPGAASATPGFILAALIRNCRDLREPRRGR